MSIIESRIGFRGEFTVQVRRRGKIISETKTSQNNELFTKGRHADIFVNNNKIGEIGEIDSNILENFRIRTSVVGFEIKLSGLIFD